MSKAMNNEEYLAAGGNKCPNCSSDNIEGGGVDVDAGHCAQQVTCNDCDAAWVDVYHLTGFEQLGLEA